VFLEGAIFNELTTLLLYTEIGEALEEEEEEEDEEEEVGDEEDEDALRNAVFCEANESLEKAILTS